MCGNEDHCYGPPVALGDVKLLLIQDAIHETALYCSTSCLAQSGVSHRSPIHIGLPCTVNKLVVYVYIESKYTKDNDAKGHYMWGIQVAAGSPHSKELLCTLYCGIHYILRESLYLCEPIQTPVPLYKTKLRLHVLTEGEKYCVFWVKETQFVYKYFKDSFEHPNQDLLISVGGFEDVEVEKVTETLTVLRYRYISGNHEPQKVGEFRGVIKTQKNCTIVGMCTAM